MLDFTDEQKMAQGAVRAFCRERIEPKVAALESGEVSGYPLMRDFAATFGLGEMVKARFARGALRPGAEGGEREGGEGASSFGGSSLVAIVMMELSRTCPGFALSFGASFGLFGGAVMARGTPLQKEKWALPALTFDRIGAWALTEPGAGSDAFGAMATRARRVDGGFRLRGSKTFITNAPFADVFVVYARTGAADEGGAGDVAAGAPADVRAFLLARGAEGLTTGAPMKKMGMHASPTGEIFLDDVFVPDEDVLGGVEDRGLRAAAKASLAGERFAMTPMCLGIVDRCLEESVRYAKARTQWGRPISEFQLIQEKIARMYTARTILFTMLLRQLEAAKEKKVLPPSEASAQKLFAARAATECALEAVQVMGGAGYMAGSVVEMMARDAKLFQIGGGTDEVQILRIARDVLSAG